MEIYGYDLGIATEHLKPGIFKYDEPVYWISGIIPGIFTYRVKLICLNKPKLVADNAIKKENYEIIEFIGTFDLSSYQSTSKVRIFDDDEEETLVHVDWKTLCDKFVPGAYEYAEERLKRKLKRAEKEPRKYTKNSDDEFLTFTEETAYYWAGYFEKDGDQGCCMQFGKNEYAREFPILDARSNFSYWQLPLSLKSDLDSKGKELGHPNGDYYIYNWTTDQKREYYDSLPITQKYELTRTYFDRYLKDNNEFLDICLPYRIHLFGTDDCSYSKWFPTEEEMMKEVNFLRMMQPLDFNKDIRNRNYIFTN